MRDELADQLAAAEDEFAERRRAGPKRLRWADVPLQVGDAAPDLELEDATGDTVALSSFWGDGPAILMFWRHFGCGCGMDRARRLAEERSGFGEVGAEVVIIGQGEPERAAAYARRHGIVEPVLCDPEFRAYNAYGVLEGTAAQVVFDASEEYLRGDEEAWQSLTEARRDDGSPLVDSPWQLPAEFVVDGGGLVRLAYRYQYCEDFPDHRVLLAAVKEAHWAS